MNIDFDKDSIQLDGKWYSRDELAKKIKSMIDASDFQISKPSQALEALNQAISQAKVLTVKVPGALHDALATAAAKAGKPLTAYIRDQLHSLVGPVEKAQAPSVVMGTAPVSQTASTVIVRPDASSGAPPVIQAQVQTAQVQTAQVKTAPGPIPTAPVPEPKMPSVVIDESLRMEPLPVSSPDNSGAPKAATKKEDEEVERRWFSS